MEAVIFDADHTLYTPEVERAYRKKFEFLAAETGIDRERISEAWEETVEEAEGKVHRKELIERMLERAGVEPTERLVEEAYDLFWDTVLEDLVFEEGLPQMLERLDRKFEILAIATDELPGALEMKLSTVFHEPEEIFDDFVTPKEVDEMKPSESFYRKILENHGIEPGEAVMVGDSWERDLEPAQDLGMVTVLVGGSGEGGPDHRIETITDLEEVLEEIR